MKKALLLSVVASTMMMAGGDIAPVVDEPVMVVEDNGFYLGLGYGFMNVTVDDAITGTNNFDEDFSSVMLQAGYKFNSYFAVEGRYWFGLDDVTKTSGTYSETVDAPDAWGIYAKPMFPVTEDLDIYGLVGYASADIDYSDSTGYSGSDNYDGFSWGLGLSYAITDSFTVFADYVALTDETIEFADINIETYNVGVTYNF